MRINVYSQELTSEVIALEKVSNTGRVYQAAQLIMHSSERLHHPPMDDDRSAVTFWLPSSAHRREEMAQAFEEIARIFRGAIAQQPAPIDATSIFLGAVDAELRRARSLFPGDRIMGLALAEEFGELIKAMLDESGANVWKEAVQTAVMAARVAIDGDSSVDGWRAFKGLDNHRCGAAEARHLVSIDPTHTPPEKP